MRERPTGRGHMVPGKELSDAVQRAAETCGFEVKRKVKSYGGGIGCPGLPRMYDVVEMAFYNGKNLIGLPKKEKTEVYIDPQQMYGSLASISIPHNGDGSPFNRIYSELHKMENERASGNKR